MPHEQKRQFTYKFRRPPERAPGKKYSDQKWNRTQDLLRPEQEKNTPMTTAAMKNEGKDAKLHT